ncbi:MAG TPA: succinylglutamate desuccinylase/aspartoacylase family protein [Acetobacteraceae bacterium]
MTRISCSIPLDAPGRHIGQLGVPFSDDAHAYGVIPVPIAVLGGRSGPTVLLSAGVHGDEYEGQIVLRRLLREVDTTQLGGRLILLPALNLPAVRAARRCSPIDGANMNRAFPGDADGGPTAQLAHFVEQELLARCQAAVDLHSGGTASEYLPCAYVYAGGPMAEAKTGLAHAFGAPLAVVVGATAETRSLSAACERGGVPMIAAELGGGARVDAGALAVADGGTRAVLRHLGMLPAEPGDAARRTRFVQVPGRAHFLMCPTAGLFEPLVVLGETVEAGALAGWVHDVDDPAVAPVGVRFAAPGIVVARRLPALARRGDYLFTTAVETAAAMDRA